MSHQSDLFGATDNDDSDRALECQVMPLQDGMLQLYPQFLSETEQWFEQLMAAVDWRQDTLYIAGQERLIPRLNAWYADEQMDYSYSGLALHTHSWIEPLTALRKKVEAAVGQSFNSVLANLYRDGNDSVAWHADDEPELGCNPVIASLTLGQPRRFVMKHQRDKQLPKRDLLLPDGSLLIMSGATRHHWYHQIPKTRQPVGPRINLTFRTIYSPS